MEEQTRMGVGSFSYTLDEYQKKAMETCMDSSRNFSYMLQNLVGEVGELAGKVAKAQRKGLVSYTESGHIIFSSALSDEERGRLVLSWMFELGDVFWQAFGLASVMGWSAEHIAEMNIAKLSIRKENNTIDGEGDGVTKEERGK